MSSEAPSKDDDSFFLRPQRFTATRSAAAPRRAIASLEARDSHAASDSESTTPSQLSSSSSPLSASESAPSSAAAPSSSAAASSSSASSAPAPVISMPTNVSVHPLQCKWAFWFDKPNTAQKDAESYASGLIRYAGVDSVEAFWRVFNFTKQPNECEVGANLYLFKDDIKARPMWEDPANAKGGKWQIRLKRADRNLLDEFWLNMCLGMIGGAADEDGQLCGVVVSRRRGGGDRIAVWCRTKDDKDTIMALGKHLREVLLDGVLHGDFGMEWTFHEDALSTKGTRGDRRYVLQ